jgi:hypothetical protein
MGQGAAQGAPTAEAFHGLRSDRPSSVTNRVLSACHPTTSPRTCCCWTSSANLLERATQKRLQFLLIFIRIPQTTPCLHSNHGSVSLAAHTSASRTSRLGSYQHLPPKRLESPLQLESTLWISTSLPQTTASRRYLPSSPTKPSFPSPH